MFAPRQGCLKLTATRHMSGADLVRELAIVRDKDVILNFYAKMVPEVLMGSLQRSSTGSSERCG